MVMHGYARSKTNTIRRDEYGGDDGGVVMTLRMFLLVVMRIVTLCIKCIVVENYYRTRGEQILKWSEWWLLYQRIPRFPLLNIS